MANAKHTPGPWWLEEDDERYPRLSIIGPRKNCSINGVPDTWEMARIDNAHFWDVPGVEAEDRANAALIAAAPEMLAALEAVSRSSVIFHGDEVEVRISIEALEQARAVIRKARGEEVRHG